MVLSRLVAISTVLWILLFPSTPIAATFAVFGDPQFGTNCLGPTATAYPYSVAAFDWVAGLDTIHGAILVGDMVHTNPVGTPIDCECWGSGVAGNCEVIDHSLHGLGTCTGLGCGNADAITCNGGTSGLYCAWERMRALVDKLEVVGIPWMATPGNHDCDMFMYKPAIRCVNGAAWTVYNKYFGPGAFTGNAQAIGWLKGETTDTIAPTLVAGIEMGASSYMVIEVEGQRFLFIGVHYFITDELVSWVHEVVAKYPGMPTILFSHIIHKGDDLPNGWTQASGPKFLESFGDIPQIFMHISGHAWDVYSFKDTSNEYTLLGQMMDYSYTGSVQNTTLPNQDQDHGGGGAVAIMTIDIVAGQVSWYVYSPADDTFDVHATDENIRSYWSEKVQFCGTGGRFKMDPGACVGYSQPTPASGVGK